MSAIKLENVSYSYDDKKLTLNNINLTVEAGECILITGPSGCGKTTLLRLLNGLAPHYFHGELSGRIYEMGECINDKEIYEISENVGTVFQNPRSQFFCVDTESELAFASENRGLEAELIRKRVGETIKKFSMDDLVGKSLFAMSGGQKQKVACASIDVALPEIILLDEPSANLDYQSTALLSKIIAMWKKQEKTILIADHRTAYLRNVVDSVLVMDSGNIKEKFSSQDFADLSQADRSAMGLRSGIFEDPEGIQLPQLDKQGKNISTRNLNYYFKNKLFGKKNPENSLAFKDVTFEQGKITAIVGQNGLGKTSFLRSFCGLERKTDGEIYIDGERQSLKKQRENVFLVMQDVNHQLFTDSVVEEINISLPGDMDEKEKQARIEKILSEMDLDEFADRHPMSLSGGQKQRVAIACAIASEREILVFDEPTSGLDYSHMIQVAQVLKKLKGMGKTIIIVTHDSELIHECCDRTVAIERLEKDYEKQRQCSGLAF